MLADHEHLAQVRLRRGVALEAVLVAALFLADLAVPPQALQALGFHRICDRFRGSGWRLRGWSGMVSCSAEMEPWIVYLPSARGMVDGYLVLVKDLEVVVRSKDD